MGESTGTTPLARRADFPFSASFTLRPSGFYELHELHPSCPLTNMNRTTRQSNEIFH